MIQLVGGVRIAATVEKVQDNVDEGSPCTIMKGCVAILVGLERYRWMQFLTDRPAYTYTTDVARRENI